MYPLAHLTIGQIAVIYGIPAWKIRRVVDSLGIEIPRIGMYRTVPREMLGVIAAKLQEQGWLPSIPAPAKPHSKGFAAHEHDVVTAEAQP